MILHGLPELLHRYIVLFGDTAFADDAFITKGTAAALIPGIDLSGAGRTFDLRQPMKLIRVFIIGSVFHFSSPLSNSLSAAVM